MNFLLIFFLSVFLDSYMCIVHTDGKGNNFTYSIAEDTIIDKLDLGKYVVSLQRYPIDDAKFGWYHLCGGSIIGKNKILTAAHCVYNYEPNQIAVVVGLRHRFMRSNYTQVKEVATIIIHKSYKNTLSGNDIALLLLKEDVLNNSQTGIIQIPDQPPRKKQSCTVIGWGNLYYNGPSSSELGFAYVQILPRVTCVNKYKSFKYGMLCAGDPVSWGQGFCKFDAGGPLICKSKIVGIVSWARGCAWKEWPGIYTDAYFYKRWIEANRQTRIYPVALTIFLTKFLT